MPRDHLAVVDDDFVSGADGVVGRWKPLKVSLGFRTFDPCSYPENEERAAHNVCVK